MYSFFETSKTKKILPHIEMTIMDERYELFDK